MLGFEEISSPNSQIVNAEDGNTEARTLDGLLGSERVTFIKMDIEGAEVEALKGAKEIIQRDRPKLAISAYHRAEDIVNIPILVKEFVPDYHLYFRHYSNDVNETVLYAV